MALVNNLFDLYDILLIDLYGVIWNGIELYQNSLEELKHLVSSGKNVTILSNTSSLSIDMAPRYNLEKFKEGVYFTDFVTSGDVLKSVLIDGNLCFESRKNPKKYFMYGLENEAPFLGSRYERVLSIDDADFVYISTPTLSDADVQELPNDMRKYLYLYRSPGNKLVWLSTSIEPFIPKLKYFLKKKKPLVVSNPDRYTTNLVFENPNSDRQIKVQTVHHGSIGLAYEKVGGEVFIIGKPYDKIYKYAITQIAKRYGSSVEDVCKKHIAMVGDTLETDILGAENASKSMNCSIDSILVMTGMTARSMQDDEKSDVFLMKKFFEEKGIVPTHVMSELGTSAKIFY